MRSPQFEVPLIRKGWILLGVFLLIAGSAITVHYYQSPPPEMQEHNFMFYRCLLGTIILSGLCLICGTTRWWFRD